MLALQLVLHSGAAHMKIVFAVVLLLNKKNRYCFFAFIYELFPQLGEIYFGGLLMVKMARTNFKKAYSVLLSVTISGLCTSIICFWGKFYIS